MICKPQPPAIGQRFDAGSKHSTMVQSSVARRTCPTLISFASLGQLQSSGPAAYSFDIASLSGTVGNFHEVIARNPVMSRNFLDSGDAGRLNCQMDQKAHRVVGLAREVHTGKPAASLKMYYKYILTAALCITP